MDFDQALSEIEERSRLKDQSTPPFQRRPYQLRIADAVFKASQKPRNSIVDLPTGTGKTNVAVLVSLMLSLRKERKKTLYIVPTRTLIAQVVRASGWAYPFLRRVGLSSRLAANAFDLNASVLGSDLLVSTPGILASRLERGTLDRQRYLRTVGLVVLDEFDEFLIPQMTRRSVRVRFDVDLQHLLDNFKSDQPFCLMSATVPGQSQLTHYSGTEALFSEFIEDKFSPEVFTAHSKHIHKYMPSVIVEAVPCTDAVVSACHEALDYRMATAIRDYECDEGVRLDGDHLLERLPEIVAGKIKRVKSRDGEWLTVDDVLLRLCQKLLATIQKYTYLYEDMFAGFAIGTARVPRMENCVVIEDEWIEIKILEDLRRDRSRYSVSLRAKAYTLLDIIKSHVSERGVVFTRFIRLSDALGEFIARSADTKAVTIFKLDSRIQSEQERGAVLQRFAEAKGGAVLILTRSTGRRGLDIPAADYCVLYSPKEEEYVVWQELSRIRSRLGAEKPAYILCYRGSSEETRLRALVADMSRSGRKYELLVQSRT